MLVPYKHQIKKKIIFMLISAAKKLVYLERYLLIDIRNEHIIDGDDDRCDDDADDDGVLS